MPTGIYERRPGMYANRKKPPIGPESKVWRGGRLTNKRDRYVRVWVSPDDWLYDEATPIGGSRYMLEHRYVMAHQLGRPLLREEEVHHKNGDRKDNRIDNLELWSHSQPPGQRVEDKLRWAHEIIALYECNSSKGKRPLIAVRENYEIAGASRMPHNNVEGTVEPR